MVSPPRSPRAELADAVDELAESLGKVLRLVADQLRSGTEPTAEAAPGPGPGSGEASDPEPDRARLGARQGRMLEVLAKAGAQGLTAAQVAREVSVNVSNVHRALGKLEERRLVVGTGESPKLWRIAADGTPNAS